MIGPSRFVPTAIVFPAQDIVKGYNDITLRGGAAIDLTGDGKTSLKINAGQYMDPAQWAGIFIEPNPARTQIRRWRAAADHPLVVGRQSQLRSGLRSPQSAAER